MQTSVQCSYCYRNLLYTIYATACFFLIILLKRQLVCGSASTLDLFLICSMAFIKMRYLISSLMRTRETGEKMFFSNAERNDKSIWVKKKQARI